MSDRLYEIFTVMFQSRFGVPYRKTTQDFVQLARLLEAAPDFEERYWSEAARNFFGSSLGKFTLADLASRVEVFHDGKLDRYNKPFNSLVEGNEAALDSWLGKDTE
jgi:hypothetical protein